MSHRFTIQNKYVLTSKIKGLALNSKQLRKQIKNAFAKDKETVWLILSKIHLGSLARHHLLAYALMRGKPYRQLESKCREDNKPNAEYILTVIQLVLFKSPYLKYWDLERINQWLSEIKIELELKPISKPSFLKRLFSLQESN